MSPEDVQTVFALLVARIETADQHVTRVVPTPPARPFFDAVLAAERWGEERPRTDSSPQQQRSALDWYLELSG